MRLLGRSGSDRALQTDLQGVAGTMLKSADDTHVQLVPSCCVQLISDLKLKKLPGFWQCLPGAASRWEICRSRAGIRG